MNARNSKFGKRIVGGAGALLVMSAVVVGGASAASAAEALPPTTVCATAQSAQSATSADPNFQAMMDASLASVKQNPQLFPGTVKSVELTSMMSNAVQTGSFEPSDFNDSWKLTYTVTTDQGEFGIWVTYANGAVERTEAGNAVSHAAALTEAPAMKMSDAFAMLSAVAGADAPKDVVITAVKSQGGSYETGYLLRGSSHNYTIDSAGNVQMVK